MGFFDKYNVVFLKWCYCPLHMFYYFLCFNISPKNIYTMETSPPLSHHFVFSPKNELKYGKSAHCRIFQVCLYIFNLTYFYVWASKWELNSQINFFENFHSFQILYFQNRIRICFDVITLVKSSWFKVQLLFFVQAKVDRL